MSKKRVIVVISVIVVAIAVVSLYQTFATSSTATSTDDNTYSINLGDSSTVTVPANSSKTIYYKLTNTNNGTVNYGIGYSGTDIVVYEWHDSNDSATGTIDYQENKFIKLYIKNNSSVSSTATISAILGYENDENLIVPSGTQLVNKQVANFVEYISELYSPNATETFNEVTYNLDTTNQFIEDMDDNIRYYGANPNNYIYFNCDNYNNQTEDTCELWRVIGVFDGKVKIMKNDSIGVFSWDTSPKSINYGYGISEWSQADLMKLLNPGYENNYDLDSSGNSILVNNSLYWQGADGEEGKCYNRNSNSTTSCDFTSTGLKNDTTRNMISTSTYYLGTLPESYETSSTMDEIYISERQAIRGDFSTNTNCVSSPTLCTDNVERTGTWNGKIALLYLSDYGYASDLNLCKNKLNSNYTDEVCTTSNWIYYLVNNNAFHLINPIDAYYKLSTSAIVTINNISGKIGNSSAMTTFNTYITLYLNPDIMLTYGNGTDDKPYQINLNS